MRDLTCKEAVELLDRLDIGAVVDGSPMYRPSQVGEKAEEILIAALCGAGLFRVVKAYEAARDRAGFYYA